MLYIFRTSLYCLLKDKHKWKVSYIYKAIYNII